MLRTITVSLLLALAVSVTVWTQTAPASSQQPPTPAFGQGPVQQDEGTPLPSLDKPILEPLGKNLSYLQPGLHVGETADKISQNSFGSETRVFGSLSLRRLRGRSETYADMVSGGSFSTNLNPKANQIHEAYIGQEYLWRTGKIEIRDAFTYLPEGTFAYGSFGGSGGVPGELGLTLGGGIGVGALSGGEFSFFGLEQYSALDNAPRLSNTTILDVQQRISSRSTFTMAAGFGLLHFTDNTVGTNPFTGLPIVTIDSRQVTGEAGYDYQLTKKDRVAVEYGFQRFTFPDQAVGSFDTHVIEVLYGRQITGRINVQFGGGPQWTVFRNPISGSSNQMSVSARASVQYRMRKTTMSAGFDRFNSSGSGLFLGAETDAAHVSFDHPVTRVWAALLDGGYAHVTRLQPSPIGINAQYLNNGYGGLAMRRPFGHTFDLVLHYQFNQDYFDNSLCSALPAGQPCYRYSNRHVFGIGVDWHPRPIRLD
jgi:hypothetical protein